MNNNSINAISPIDGRYYNQTHFLDEFFSEKALIKYRLTVEVEYFIKLTESNINQLSDWNKNNNSKLRDIYINFDDSDACLLYTSPSPRDGLLSRMPSSA